LPKKLRIGILFGGRSGEHEVSLLSAASILKAIDKKKYDVVPIGITKQGRWVTAHDAQALLTGAYPPANPRLAGDPEATPTAAVLKKGDEAIIIPPVPSESLQPLELAASTELAMAHTKSALDLDVIFPVLHGTFGEDGTIQGLFELADIAYVGSGVLGSAAGMDKAAMKRLFAAANLPQTPWLSMLRSEWRANPKAGTKKIEAALKYPIFVKPANLGSSVGISKVHDRTELAAAMDLAAGYDRKLVIEQGVGGPGAKPRELEVSVLGNDTPEASVVGEIVPGAEFYDYEAKYQSDTSVPIIPAKLTAAESKQIRAMAIEAFKACDCAGLARVDFLMEPTRKGSKRKPRIYLNEINTLPGFTSISMYPKLWDATGLPYKQLIDRLIQLAIERHKEKQQTTFTRS
jgi:D-alanine-D-alanine ligase